MDHSLSESFMRGDNVFRAYLQIIGGGDQIGFVIDQKLQHR